MLKRILLAALLVALIPLGACVETRAEFDFAAYGDRFFDALLQRDYGACYQMFTQELRDELPLAELIDLYDRAVFSAIGLVSFDWQLTDVEEQQGGDAILHYSLTYRCQNIEPFTQQVSLCLTPSFSEWAIDWSPAAIFTDMQWGDRVLASTLRQKRGEILDEEANAYAVNSFGDTVYVRRTLVEDVFDVSTRLSSLLQMDAAKIRELIQAQSPDDPSFDDYAVIKTYLPDTIDATLSEMLVAIPSVGIDRRSFSPMRYYPQGAVFTHLLGYTHPIEGDIDPLRYDADSRVGMEGLEKSYEDALAGYRGREIALIDQDGNKKSPPVYRQDAQDGLDLTLTLDYDLQIRAETLLDRLPQVGATAGVIIAIDPTSGDLLAAAGFPDYDLNLFSLPIPDELYQAMNEPEANRPFYNRITTGRYPPGSTVKPLTAAMALQEGIQNQHFEFTGKIEKKQWLPTDPDWMAPPITRVSDYPGPVNMENAIVYSDNIYFGYTALKAGWNHLESFYESLGFNRPFPFDVKVTDAQVRVNKSSTNLQLLASSGFGQGEMLVSPLQMAYTFSAFANDGTIMRPRLVKDFRRMNGMSYEIVDTIQPSALYENVLTAQTLEIINPMLRKVITTGSGRAGGLQDIESLGKTGTAEIGGNKEREIAWSISFVQNTDYDRLVCVVLEVPTASEEAGPYRHTCIKEMLSP